MKIQHNNDLSLYVSWLGLLLAMAACVCGCSAHIGHKQYLIESEKSHRIRGTILEHHPALSRIRSIGAQLESAIPGFQVKGRYVLISSDETCNAFSYSDGTIYLTSGLIHHLSTNDLLAAILAHELAHVASRHGKFPCSGKDQQLQREIEADRKGLEYLEKAGFSRSAMIEVLSLFRQDMQGSWYEARCAAMHK